MQPYSEYIIVCRYKTETIYVENGDYKTDTIKWICEKQRLHMRRPQAESIVESAHDQAETI